MTERLALILGLTPAFLTVCYLAGHIAVAVAR